MDERAELLGLRFAHAGDPDEHLDDATCAEEAKRVDRLKPVRTRREGGGGGLVVMMGSA